MGESCGRSRRGATFAAISSSLHPAGPTVPSQKGEGMTLQRVVVAVDESDAGRWAARAALDLAAGTGAELVVLRTVAVCSRILPWPMWDGWRWPTSRRRRPRSRSSGWGAGSPPSSREAEGGPKVTLAIASGSPASRSAAMQRRSRADLVVLGRKRRSAKTRLLIGDTADAVARRSRIPCSSYRPGPPMRRILAALDGTDWGLAVMMTASPAGGRHGRGAPDGHRRAPP